MKKTHVELCVDDYVSFTTPQKNTLVLNHANKNDALRTKNQSYDCIVLDQILEKETDIQQLLQMCQQHLRPRGRLIIVYRNFLYSFFSGIWQALIGTSKQADNWLWTNDIVSFARLADFELVSHQPVCLLPFYIPLLTNLTNRLLLYFFPFNHLSIIQAGVFRKNPVSGRDSSVSIIVPARNEAGTIEKLIKELPVLGSKTEIIFVEGNSHDHTRAEIDRSIQKYQPRLPFTFKVVDQKNGVGKADAVRKGFKAATGDILMIYDADMSVAPLDLNKFYLAIISGKGDFINGSRLVYPMNGKAMQFLNILGNKFFSVSISWILGQKLKDTLCGTKVLWRTDWKTMQQDQSLQNMYDPFGDFELLLGAGKLNLKIIDLPIRYFERTYGATNIKRFTNGWELAKFTLTAIKKIKMRYT